MAATTWHGRRGPVILGPTEHRVARWLNDATRHGRIRIRTVDLVAATHVERSEIYRITARLRVLGLFGIENDRSGSRGGRQIWRTPTLHDGPGLDPVRHRLAWRRVVGWGVAHQRRIADRLAAIRNHTGTRPRDGSRVHLAAEPDPLSGSAAPTFAARMRSHGLGRLMDGWGVA
jgi:hypothetical protein